LTAELAVLLLKTLREKSNPKNMPETNNVFYRLAVRMLFLMFFATASPCRSSHLQQSLPEVKAKNGTTSSWLVRL